MPPEPRARSTSGVSLGSKPRSTSATASSLLHPKNRDAHRSKAPLAQAQSPGGRNRNPRRGRTVLKDHPFREMSVDNVMAGTGLSRPSFYEYFHDRHDLYS